jgi:Thioredoxin-like [2Fe-2S] ferredoxin
MLQKIEGHFVRWQNSSSGQPQSMLVQTPTVLQSIRLGKNLRYLLLGLLQPGMSLSLQAKLKKQRLRAKFIVLLPLGESVASQSFESPAAVQKPVKIKVCTSKHCCKNGSQQICSALEKIATGVNIKVYEVGCLGGCRNAPVVKIADREYHNLAPKQAVALALKHAELKPANRSTVFEV